MIRRQKQALLRLQKISEASSPSPSRDVTQSQLTPQRINTMTLTPVPVIRHQLSPCQEERNGKLTSLQEEIMERKRRLNSWEEAQQVRQSRQSNIADMFLVLVRGIGRMGANNIQVKHSILRIVRGGRKGVIEWVLGWIRELFWLISLVITQRHVSKK